MRVSPIALIVMAAAWAASLAAAEMETRFYALDGQRLDDLRGVVPCQTAGMPAGHGAVHQGGGDDDDDDDGDAHQWMEQLLRGWGVPFPPGSRVSYYERQRKLILHRALEDALHDHGMEMSPVLVGVQIGQDKVEVLATIATRSEARAKGTVLLTDMPTAGQGDKHAAEAVIMVWSGVLGSHGCRHVAVLFFGRDGKLIDWYIKRERTTVP
jgi:hypothetical protein